MNIYRLILNKKDVKSTRRFGRSNGNRNQEEGSTRDNVGTRKQLSRTPTRGGKESKNLGLLVRESKPSSKSSIWQAWTKSKNFLILSSLFFMPFIVNNLTYFYLLDFSIMGYDLQAFNNLGAYR